MSVRWWGYAATWGREAARSRGPGAVRGRAARGLEARGPAVVT